MIAIGLKKSMIDSAEAVIGTALIDSQAHGQSMEEVEEEMRVERLGDILDEVEAAAAL